MSTSTSRRTVLLGLAGIATTSARSPYTVVPVIPSSNGMADPSR